MENNIQPSPEQRPKVGIGVLVFKDGKVLLGKRKGSFGAGEWASPGGHLEYMESFEECGRREVFEETGLTLGTMEFQLMANVTDYAPKHYVHMGFIAQWKEGEPRVCEPEKCESWEWFSPDNLPAPLFVITKLALDDYKNRKIFYDKRG